MKSKNIVIALVVIIIVASGLFWLINTPGRAGQYDGFAQCLAQKNVKFYGAFWCPVCRSQKAIFGRSSKHLPYVECSTPDGKSTLQICLDKNIERYPTWEFEDGEKVVGELSLSELSQRTGCALPQ